MHQLSIAAKMVDAAKTQDVSQYMQCIKCGYASILRHQLDSKNVKICFGLSMKETNNLLCYRGNMWCTVSFIANVQYVGLS